MGRAEILFWSASIACMGCNDGLIDPARDTIVHRDVDADGQAPVETSGGEGCPVRIAFAGAPQATRVEVAGAWSGLQPDDAMARIDGEWVLERRLPPGEYAYRFVVNGTPEAPPGKGVPSHWIGETMYRNLRVEDCTRGHFVVDELVVGDGRVRARLCFEAGAAPLATMEVRLDGVVLAAPADTEGCVTIDEALAVGRGKHRIEASATDAAKASDRDDPFWIPFWEEPLDWRDATLYMVMPDRFRDSDGVASPVAGPEPIANWMGGDLAGVTKAIDDGWFEALGVTALWLTPVLEQPEGAFVGLDGVHLYAGYHGYWPTDARAIDTRFGGEAAFRAMVAAAHARGIRVVLDVVLNHVHETHPYCELDMCRTTCVCGTPGCDWEARARDCQFATYLPDLDYRDFSTVARVTDDVVAFVRDFDIDGLRLDAVKHVDHAIVQSIRGRLRGVEGRGGAPFWLVGETFTTGDGQGLVMDWVHENELDGQFDFPLYWSVRESFAGGTSFRVLEGALAKSEAAYGESLAWMSPFLGNHDVPRMATAIAGNDQGPFGGTPDRMAAASETPTEWDIINRQSMAFAFLLSLRGIPLIFMGDEIGLGGSNDPDNRRLVFRGDGSLTANQSEVLRRVRELGAARREHRVLRRGERRELWIDDTLYVQGRWLPGEATAALVVMNKGAGQRRESVTIPAELGVEGKVFRSLFSARAWPVSGGAVTLDLAPFEYAILVAE